MKITLITALVAGGLLTGASQAAAGKEVIRFLSVQVSAKQTSANVVVINNNDLINGKKVGHDTLTCKLLSQTKANCSVLITLAGGKLHAKFAISSTATSGKGAITSGTGKYAGAKGSFTFKNLNAKGNRTSVVVTLT